MSKYQSDGTHEVTIVRERVRDMETEHISFGRLKALAEREKKRKQKERNKTEPEIKTRRSKSPTNPNGPKRR